jgi:hypothetical protein
MEWARFPKSASAYDRTDGNDGHKSALDINWPYAVQLVQQVNFGPLESKRYFVPRDERDRHRAFQEITERGLIEANSAKVNS